MTVDWGDVSPVVYHVRQDGKELVGTWSNGRASETIIK
jgi:hypothetical protein